MGQPLKCLWQNDLQKCPVEKRELEQPDIHAALIYPANPAIIWTNSSNIKPIKDGLYQLITINIDQWLGEGYQLVQTIATKIDSIRPDSSSMPHGLQLILDPNKPLKNGDRLYGYLIISCPECITQRVYWVLIKYGEEGWFMELSETDSEYSQKVLRDLDPSTADEHISRFLSRKDDLVEMPKRLW